MEKPSVIFKGSFRVENQEQSASSFSTVTGLLCDYRAKTRTWSSVLQPAVALYFNTEHDTQGMLIFAIHVPFEKCNR